jgi:hypothetical protein
MTSQDTIQLLSDTGHLAYPRGEHKPIASVEGTPVSAAVQEAIASYQEFHSQNLDPLAIKHHSRPLCCDGILGPATEELMAQPRCGCPDHGPDVAAATGSGSWQGCHGIGDFHCAKAYVDKRQMPSFLNDTIEEIWANTVAAYDAIGLRWMRTEDKAEANTVITWETGRTSWIGLAIVGQGQSCQSTIWAKFSARYNPDKTVRMWSGLLCHELGHNAGLGHTRGGIMNPYILDLPASWQDDPSRPVLERKYGGEPIDGGEEEYWTQQGLKSNRGREVWVPLTPPRLVGEDA